MLKLHDLQFNRPNLPLKFSLSLDRGQRLAVMGSSGSGKSTLLDLIAGFEKPASGTLEFAGEDLIPMRVQDRPVTLLAQSQNLFPHLSLFDNVALGLSLKSRLTAAQRNQVQEVIAEVELTGFEDRKPDALSGGQQQRAALARSLLRDKAVLLLDEPFSALDQDLRADMAALVNKVVKTRNLCLITVTHDRQDAALLADICMRLENGVLVQA